MAAHVITALNQLTDDIRKDRVNWEFIQAALNFSCWTEDLDLDDYIDLDQINQSQNIDLLSDWITSIFNKYFAEWFKIGQPRTREDWRKLKYS
jgi:hypothetical protein